MAGEICFICGKQKGLLPSVANKWHRCTNCGSIYCDECGRTLPGKTNPLDPIRSCPRCGNRTSIF